MSSPALQSQPPPAADEATAKQVLALATSALRARRLAEVEEIRLAVQWAVAHGHPRDTRATTAIPW